MTGTSAPTTNSNSLYHDAAEQFGGAIRRLAAATERDADRARDLEQDIHVALWRSLTSFNGECSLKTWTYRVAHNVAASHARSAAGRILISLSSIAAPAAKDDLERDAVLADARERLRTEIRSMSVTDRQVALLYLEDLGSSEIGEITGLDAGAVSVRIHRIKKRLTAKFGQGECP
jgi:RNA polymerase sigma-70 factor (ECF subfamily)